MKWRVSAMHGRAESGRSRPPKVELVAPNGVVREGYLKGPQLHSAKSPYCLEREWLATRLAKDLGLPCAEVVPVEVTPGFLQMSSALGMTEFEDGPQLLLASISMGAGWSEWTSAVPVRKMQLATASGIYFFDTMIQNWDRVIPNPNLLIREDTYGMIDHEESFVNAAGTVDEKGETALPWNAGGIINDVGEYLEHPLWKGIKQHKNATFHPIVNIWKSLPEATIKGYAGDCVFKEWSSHIADNITDYLVEAVENIDEVHMQIEANRCN